MASIRKSNLQFNGITNFSRMILKRFMVRKHALRATERRQTGGGCGGSEQSAKARLEGADHPANRRWLRYGRDHAWQWHQQNRCVALAGALQV
jgi:hypothetical protein